MPNSHFQSNFSKILPTICSWWNPWILFQSDIRFGGFCLRAWEIQDKKKLKFVILLKGFVIVGTFFITERGLHMALDTHFISVLLKFVWFTRKFKSSFANLFFFASFGAMMINFFDFLIILFFFQLFYGELETTTD